MNLPIWLKIAIILIPLAIFIWMKLAQAGAYVEPTRKQARFLAAKVNNAAARKQIEDLRKFGLLTKVQAAVLTDEFSNTPAGEEPAVTTADLKEYTRPNLTTKQLQSVGTWSAKLTAGKTAQQALRLLIMENIRLTTEVNLHRRARGYKELPVYE